MELIKNLGFLALGSRMRLLLDNLFSDVAKVYKEYNLDFEPRFFTVFYLLKNKHKAKITDFAREAGKTQPAASQLTEIMAKKGLVRIYKDKNDSRKKIVVLTKKGEDMIPVLETIWEDLIVAHKELFDSIGVDIINVLEKTEIALAEKSMYNRIIEKTRKRELRTIEIIDYKPSMKNYFKTLNYEWLKKYFKVEKPDELILSNPRENIIDKGGFILFAKVDDTICGTLAMIKHDSTEFELSKMAVTEKYQGLQIGRKLATEAIERAKKLGAKKISLETNPDLTKAVELYRKLGFERVPYTGDNKSQFKRPTFKMELSLKY